MRIDRIHIDGFGRAEDTDLSLSSGLTLIRGANGTGKTTVHQFVHAVLFGFVKDHFPLVRGGRRGGVIHGSLDDGRAFEIIRHGDPVTGAGQKLAVTLEHANGTAADQLLGSITGGVTKHVFESVFAFGQDELRDVSRLTNAEVANRIYGASIGVIGDVLKVEAGINGQLDGLWTKRGYVKIVNRRLDEIERLSGQLWSRNLPAEYGVIRRTLEETEQQRSTLDTDIADLEVRRREIEQVLAARSPWETAAGARRQLDALPTEPPATAEDLALEAALAEAVVISSKAADAARSAREQLDSELAASSYRADVIDRATEIDSAVTASVAWRSRQTDIDERRQRQTALLAGSDRALGEAGWDQARLREADLPQFRTAVAEHVQADLDGPSRGTAGPAERARGAAADLEREHARLAAVGAQIEALGETDEKSADALDLHARELADDLTRAELLQATISATPPPSPRRRSPVGRVVIAGGTAAVVVGILLAIAVTPVIGVAVSLLGLAAGVAAFLIDHQASAGVPGPAVEHPMLGQLRVIEARIQSRWQDLGLAPPPTIDGLEPVRAEANRVRHVAENRRGLERERDRVVAEVATAEAGASAAKAAEMQAQAAVTAGLDRWMAFLRTIGFPVGLDRDGATGLVSRLEGALSSVSELAKLSEGIAKTERERLAWEQGVRRLASELGVTPDDDADVLVERLRQELANARTLSKARETLVRRRDEKGAVERTAVTALSDARAELSTFLTEHGVPDAAALAARHDRSLARARVTAALAQAEESFVALVPTERRASVEAALRADAQEGLEAQVAAQRAAIEGAAEARDALLAEEGRLGEQVRRLKADADTSKVRQALADERGALVADAQRWLVLRIAAELLHTTRGTYEAMHRPAVLARAEALFVAWTDGEYSGFDRLAESGLDAVVNAADGKSVPLVGLSRGTTDQLYLAMRIALVEYLATQQESLPLIMDDVLVNFDPERGERVARTIEEVAAGRQVIYLTCHREVALRPNRTIELGRDVEVLSAINAG